MADLVFSYAAVGFLVPFLAAGLIPAARDYHRGLPISVSSAWGIRFRPEVAPQLEEAIRYLRKNTAPGEPLFTMPGMPSFYIWTQRPSMTTYNVVAWSWLTPQMQESIAARLPLVRFLVVNRKSRSWMHMVEASRSVPDRSTLLRDRIFQDYAPLPSAVWLGRRIPEKDLLFEIWVRRKDLRIRRNLP